MYSWSSQTVRIELGRLSISSTCVLKMFFVLFCRYSECTDLRMYHALSCFVHSSCLHILFRCCARVLKQETG